MATYDIDGLQIDSDTIKSEDMPNEVFSEIFDFCGADVAIKLLKYMAGNLIQVPTNGFIKLQKKIILKDYDGTTASIRSLARKFKITEGYIRNVLEINKIPVPADGQHGFFDNETSEN